MQHLHFVNFSTSILTPLSLYRHVKALESRSQLLDAALASADEANRRWEDCRALVDQLRIENAALRAALNQLQQQQATAGVTLSLPVSIAGIGQSNPQPQPGAPQPPPAGENAPPSGPTDQTNQVNQGDGSTEAAKENPTG
ncbi:hypothetical protein BC629DRAFT_755865 [Irpex lacteus]|nr:hypothetical protein BC629DRAFT_755865 [Irpex lacteus]